MPITAEDCYARAAECDKRAGLAKRFEMKVQHRELAEEWRYLASQIERIASLPVEHRKSAAVNLRARRFDPPQCGHPASHRKMRNA
jgi:hypothetical protein